MVPFYVWKETPGFMHFYAGTSDAGDMYWKMKNWTAKLGLKGRRPLEELKRICIALTKEESYSMSS